MPKLIMGIAIIHVICLLDLVGFGHENHSDEKRLVILAYEM